MTVARYLEEPQPDSSKGKKETKPREEEKVESLPDLPLFEEEEKKSSIPSAVAARPREAPPEEKDSPSASKREEEAPPPIQDEPSMSIQHDEAATPPNHTKKGEGAKNNGSKRKDKKTTKEKEKMVYRPKESPTST